MTRPEFHELDAAEREAWDPRDLADSHAILAPHPVFGDLCPYCGIGSAWSCECQPDDWTLDDEYALRRRLRDRGADWSVKP